MPVVKVLPIRRPHLYLPLLAMVYSFLVLGQALRIFRLPIRERMGIGGQQVSRSTNLKEGIRVVVDGMVMITIGETGTMDEM